MSVAMHQRHGEGHISPSFGAVGGGNGPSRMTETGTHDSNGGGANPNSMMTREGTFLQHPHPICQPAHRCSARVGVADV